jgi:hypothetical protein
MYRKTLSLFPMLIHKVMCVVHCRASELAGIAIHKDRPVGDAEQAACSQELSKEQISKLVIGPKVGTVIKPAVHHLNDTTSIHSQFSFNSG